MNEAVILVILGLSFFEVSFLLLYNIENSFLTLFFPKLFFEKVKKKKQLQIKNNIFYLLFVYNFKNYFMLEFYGNYSKTFL